MTDRERLIHLYLDEVERRANLPLHIMNYPSLPETLADRILAALPEMGWRKAKSQDFTDDELATFAEEDWKSEKDDVA